MYRSFLIYLTLILFTTSSFAIDTKEEKIVGLDVRSSAELFINSAPGAVHISVSDITKELVYGGVGVEKIGYEGEDLEEYYTNLLSEVKSNETA